MEWGEQYAYLERIDAEESFTPRALQTKPVVEQDMMELISAFNLLSSRRTGSGFSVNPISLTDIGMYVQLFGIPWCGLEFFVRLMVQMDKLVLKKANPSDD